MKKLIYGIATLIVLTVLVLPACKKKEEPAPVQPPAQEQQAPAQEQAPAPEQTPQQQTAPAPAEQGK